MTLEQLRQNAYILGDHVEVKRLERLMARLDSQRQAYGRSQRCEEKV
jgi:hypothetical protein